MIQHENSYVSPMFPLGHDTQCDYGYHHYDNFAPNHHQHVIHPFDDDYDDNDDEILSGDLSSYLESSNADFHCDFDTILDD